MLHELVKQADRLSTEGRLKIGYKDFSEQDPIKWVASIGRDGAVTIRKGGPEGPRPYRVRSSGISPYLFVDQAAYVLGVGTGSRTTKQAEAFRELIKDASRESEDSNFQRVSEALANITRPSESFKDVQGRDYVAVEIDGAYPHQGDAAEAFWNKHIAAQCASGKQGTCSVCQRSGDLVKTLPYNVSLAGETPQISSFNDTAFCSFGKKQTLNASLCFDCGAKASAALDQMLRMPEHRAQIARGSGQNANARFTQTAVFWVESEDQENGMDSLALDVVHWSLDGHTTSEEDDEVVPTHIRKFLMVPHHGDQTRLELPQGRFHVVIVSPNKSRIIIRDWLQGDVGDLQQNLQQFFAKSSIVGPWGDEPRIFPLRQAVGALGTSNPHLVRQLIDAAYRGRSVPLSVLSHAAHELRNPKYWKGEKTRDRNFGAALPPILSLVRLCLNQVNPMNAPKESLDPELTTPAYVAGRVLAIVAEAQRAALGGDTNSTIVDRFYASASSAPKHYLGYLIRQAETAYLPNLRKNNKTGIAVNLQKELEQTLTLIQGPGDLPAVLSTTQQAEFALGFYHQRAAFRHAAIARKQTDEDKEVIA